LRAAIQEANETDGADTINFDIPAAGDPGCDSGSGVCTISPATGLPVITGTVSIDGYTQPGSQPSTLAVDNDAVLKIELDATKASSAGEANGLNLSDDPSASTSNCVIQGLVINDFNPSGIFVGAPGAILAALGRFSMHDPASDFGE
jgi:hypothetical protein